MGKITFQQASVLFSTEKLNLGCIYKTVPLFWKGCKTITSLMHKLQSSLTGELTSQTDIITVRIHLQVAQNSSNICRTLTREWNFHRPYSDVTKVFVDRSHWDPNIFGAMVDCFCWLNNISFTPLPIGIEIKDLLTSLPLPGYKCKAPTVLDKRFHTAPKMVIFSKHSLT